MLGIPLAGLRIRVYRLLMRRFAVICLSLALLAGCEPEDREVTVTERRALTLWDRSYPLDLRDRAPLSWRRIPATMMRIHNFRFGEDGAGEVYVSVTSETDPLSNVNRWRRQFGKEPVTIDEVATEEVLGTTAWVVELTGDYTPGTGRAPREGMAMRGAVAVLPGRTVTVKMVGPAELTAGRGEEFLDYCKNLEFHDVASLSRTESS